MLLRLMVTLLLSLALTIPMALLIGILVAFGRLSSDREVVVLMACGIASSPAPPGRAARRRRLGGVVVGAARGHARREPELPRADDADRGG
jgi:hypothetical protein